MKGSEIVKKIKKVGCYKIREGANHEIWYSPVTGRTFTVPRHYSHEVKTGTANSILQDAGVI
ncbi:MAG: type II toxin-antitoxin system HicA family toxin [Lachnospiraceae bacterium]|nr:type II toxin-antitoxin system HicA family toxin [Lachnospiraceae bacterium]